MSWLIYLVAIPIFAVIVLVHEFGHFITAKWSGIRVEEFGIGFPPRAIGIRRGETIYSINWLPLGGFVRMPGENGELTDPDGKPDPGSFAAKPASRRLLVLVAGVTMNLILAVVLFSVAHALGQPQFPAVIGKVVAGSPAAQAGLLPGDRILSVDGQSVRYYQDAITDVSTAVGAAPTSAATVPIVLVLDHAHTTTPVTITVNARVHPPSGQGAMGVSFSQTDPVYDRVPLWQAPIAGVQEVGTTLAAIWDGIHQVIRGTISFSDAFQGPVGIVQDSGQAAALIPQFGWYWIIYLTGALSLSLAVVNILPIPALDGGRVLLILIEIARRGKRLAPEREGLINLVGMAALLSLMALITYFDISKIFTHH